MFPHGEYLLCRLSSLTNSTTELYTVLAHCGDSDAKPRGCLTFDPTPVAIGHTRTHARDSTLLRGRYEQFVSTFERVLLLRGVLSLQRVLQFVGCRRRVEDNRQSMSGWFT